MEESKETANQHTKKIADYLFHHLIRKGYSPEEEHLQAVAEVVHDYLESLKEEEDINEGLY